MPVVVSLLGAWVMSCLLLGAADAGQVFYVATNGCDSWSGTQPNPSKDRGDGPFATLERARDAVRELRKNGGLKGTVTIAVRGGYYYLDKPFELTADDSDVVYSAYRNEKVAISGGREITGFRPVEVNGRRMIVAEIPEVKEGKWYFTQLFVNGRRRPRTRLPKEGYYRIEDLVDTPWDVFWAQGQDRFRFKEGDIKPWKNLSDVDIVALHFWVESRMPVKSVDESQRIVELGKKSVYRLSDGFSPFGARYFIENVFEALDTPGQWYLDRHEGMLYYYPAVGEDWKRAKFVAPVLNRIVGVVGDEKRRVENVRFERLRFSHTEHHLPADLSGTYQASTLVLGTVYFERAVKCGLVGCEVSSIGNYGVEFAKGCRECFVDRCRIVDMGAGGVKIHHGSEKTTVRNSEIGDGGKIFISSVGVWIGNSPDNVIIHNHIHDMNYTGVSVGWVWGYGESARGNLIEQNHIHHIGRGVLSDLGGIYLLGVQPGTVIRNNLIHDCISHGYGGWGIYTDEGSSHILIENNVVYNTKSGGFHQHYGKENIIRNNIFAFATDQQLQRTKAEEHTSFVFERNIIYYDRGQLLGSNWSDDSFKMDYNIYWNSSDNQVTFAGASFEDWRKRGYDLNSLIADPLFVDANKRDFRLKPNSPAFKLGFKEIDVSRVGPRNRRAGWGGPPAVF
ncbi:MAG: right-handed parallel beta-helix repeat-containing protein [Armatimonadetes bacterium]|nr:right-handed parallel beta-helix repeat-containing protein [Armatimonadota bacterium]